MRTTQPVPYCHLHCPNILKAHKYSIICNRTHQKQNFLLCKKKNYRPLCNVRVIFPAASTVGFSDLFCGTGYAVFTFIALFIESTNICWVPTICWAQNMQWKAKMDSLLCEAFGVGEEMDIVLVIYCYPISHNFYKELRSGFFGCFLLKFLKSRFVVQMKA